MERKNLVCWQIAMEKAEATVECGFCLRRDEALPQPKALSCTHVHCLECLAGFYEENNLIRCPTQGCGVVYAGSPDTLPPHDMKGEEDKWCDVCVRKAMDKEEAVIYCTLCSTKLCNKHLESHDDIMDQHTKITVDEFRSQAIKLQSRNCTEHNDQPYVMACKLCLSLACWKCLPSLDKCTNGTSHSLLSLDDSVATLMKDGIIAEMLTKEDQYEKLFKETSKVRATYDDKTAEMIKLIHQTRDTQMNVLNLKYQKLEDELMEKRQKSRVDMAEFMEDTVLKKWTQVRNQRQMIETRAKHSHQADIVKGFKEFKEEIQKFVEEQLPKLELTDQMELRQKDESRELELEIDYSDDIVIDSERGMTTLQPLPQSLTLLQSVQLPAGPLSVCHYNGSTYIGLNNNTVTKVDKDYKVYNSFITITTSGLVDSITAYKDRIYTLSRGSPCTVNVYDMSGGHITSWNHPGHGSYFEALAIVADQVVIPDPKNNRITVYSLNGQTLRHISCSLPDSANIRMSAVGDTSVVISTLHIQNYSISKIYHVNIATGELMWSSSDVNQPSGLISYGKYILVSAFYNTTIYILNTTTGKMVSEMRDILTAGKVYDLDVFGTTLVVPASSPRKLQFYKLS